MFQKKQNKRKNKQRKERKERRLLPFLSQTTTDERTDHNNNASITESEQTDTSHYNNASITESFMITQTSITPDNTNNVIDLTSCPPDNITKDANTIITDSQQISWQL